MAIYRGEGGAQEAEAAPGDTEFAGGIIVEGDIVSKGNITAEEDILANGKITTDEGFYGDGSNLTNLPLDNVWVDNGSSIEFKGNGSSNSQVWTVNGDKSIRLIQYGTGESYFNGDGNTFFGTRTDSVVNLHVAGSNILSIAKDSIYSAAPLTASSFIGNGSNITNIDADINNLTPEAPIDGETYARNNKTWISISDTAGIPDAPVDGIQYGRKDGAWTPTVDAYTKAESNATNDAQDGYITTNNINIASNTTAIGTLSGQVNQNSEDIAELQDSIFFTSAYSADYPSSPNRDPEDGNMYLQNVALFTYSYASATQIFVSKTDETGNVRQFTAVKPGDSIVLNEVDSPNYGRYELVSVSDVSDSYVVMNVIPKMGQGTVIEGVKVAFQAFPQPGNDIIWTQVGDTTAQYVSDDATQSKVSVASGSVSSQITQYASGASYFQGSGITNFGNLSDANISLARNGVTKVVIQSDKTVFTDPVEFQAGTTRLYSEVSPNNYSAFTNQAFIAMANGTINASVVAGKSYLITGGTNAQVNNVVGINTAAYFKLATSFNGGAYIDTKCNMIISAPTVSGGTGIKAPMERSFTYSATTTGTLTITPYIKVTGSGASGYYGNNTVRIQEVG